MKVRSQEKMKYENNIVYLSFAIAFLGSYLTISLCEQLRLLYLRQRDSNLDKVKWFLLMGISFGGVGIWCMHFIGMAAMRSADADGDGARITLYFNIPITIASLVVAILATSLGFFVLSKDRLFAKKKAEILEMFADDLKHLSISQLKRIKNYTILRLTLVKEMQYVIGGGILTGSGVVIMHYVGMSAVRFHGTIEWNWGIIVASIIIAIFAATAAFWILFRLLSIFPAKEYLRVLSAFIMAVAVCGMHYTAMEASTFKYDPLDEKVNSHVYAKNPNYFKNSEFEIPTLLTAMLVLWIIVIVLLEDLRKHVQKYQNFIIKRTSREFLRVAVKSKSSDLLTSSHGIDEEMGSMSEFNQKPYLFQTSKPQPKHHQQQQQHQHQHHFNINKIASENSSLSMCSIPSTFQRGSIPPIPDDKSTDRQDEEAPEQRGERVEEDDGKFIVEAARGGPGYFDSLESVK